MSTYSLDHIQSAGVQPWDISTAARSLCVPRLIQHVLSTRGAVLQPIQESGTLIRSLEELVILIEAHNGYRLVEEKDSHGYVYAWEDLSYLEIQLEPDNNFALGLEGYMINNSLRSLLDQIKADFISKDSSRLVFTLVQRGDNLDTRLVGNGYSPLIKENYTPRVIEDLDFVVKSFQQSPPNGRICLFNGEPGTGKTHLIRSILSEMDHVFLIVPSGLIESLDKPFFIPVLLDNHHTFKKPITLIVEDGDMCLVPRESDNMSAISSLLNLSDGIMGNIIDIRMIISTNAKIKNLDPAILRPGRLCRQIHVEPLEYKRANEVFRRLMKDNQVFLTPIKDYTLAEVYQLAHPLHEESHAPKKKAVGFSSLDL